LLKISISRGIGSAGYLPTYQSPALVIIQTLEERPRPKNVTLGISSQKLPAKNLGKTISALPYVLTKIESTQKKLFDCVMLNEKNLVAETSSANIFWVKNGRVFTPAKSCGILLGCVRKKLLEIAPLKITQKAAKISSLKNADEIFLTNSSFLVLPVDEFLGRKLQKNLANEFLKLLQNHLERTCQS
jgi:4-amino-4-deoxychorismate lyase